MNVDLNVHVPTSTSLGFGNRDDETLRSNSLIISANAFHYFAGVKLLRAKRASFSVIWQPKKTQ